MPFDGVCVLAMDPATLLPTNEVVENGLPPSAFARMAEIEMRGEDFNAFTALARSERPAASLSEATDGELERSRRHREVRREHGFGDELRARSPATARRGAASCCCAARTAGTSSRATRSSWRRCRATWPRGCAAGSCSPRRRRPTKRRLVLLAPDNSITLTNEAADEWLAELPGGPVPPVVNSVASRARCIADGSAPAGASARARVQTASGHWLLVRGSMLGDHADAQTAVTIEPARPHELAPLIADAYGLTERERAVTQLVAQGHPINTIADRLYLSPWTVQDHLKSIFEKTGVSTRGELVARLFFEHYAPRLMDSPT